MQPSQELEPAAGRGVSIPPATQVGTVTLKVADLQRSLAFYGEMIGLRPIERDERTALLGAGSRPIVAVEEVPGAQPQPRGTTGLYHAAILFPDRRSLAIKAAQIAARGYPLGQSDHLVSEAFYLSDPDGNGLELYRDRPRSEWTWNDGEVQMAVDPIDVDSLFAGITEGEQALAHAAAPDGTRLGHIHLRVSDLALAQQFYHDVLGFDITAHMPGALFMSAGGYHHHIGLNTWESRRGGPPAEPSAGLREFSLVLPNRAELDRLVARIRSAGIGTEPGDGEGLVVVDPFQNRIRLITANQNGVD